MPVLRASPGPAGRSGRRLTLPLVTALALGTTGCIALPFATPPLKGSAGVRAYYPNLPEGESVMFSGQIGVNPLQFAPKLITRRFDFGVGYIGNTNDKYYFHGAYAEVAAFPWVAKLSRRSVARASVTLQPTFFVDKRSLPGVGGGTQIGIELVSFSEGPFDSHGNKSGYFGYAFGESGIGLQLDGFGAHVFEETGGTTYYSFGAALVLRLPASAGILWAIK